MKRVIMYGLALLLLNFVPVKGTDIGKMRPVEVLFVYREAENIVIETDTGDLGEAETVLDALQDLKNTTPGFIYLNTAQYLLITEATKDAVEQLCPMLNKSVRICFAESSVDLKEAARYLPVHEELPKLSDWGPHAQLPILRCVEKRLNFLKNALDKIV